MCILSYDCIKTRNGNMIWIHTTVYMITAIAAEQNSKQELVMKSVK